MSINRLLSNSSTETPTIWEGGTSGWKLGDVYAYQLKSDLAREKGLHGKYFIFHIVDEDIWYPADVVPIVYIKITTDFALPLDIKEYDRLEYIQTWFTKYEERFWPIDMSHPQEDIERKSRIKYEVDEYGFLPQYRAKMLNLSNNVIKKHLIYVGNFTHVVLPQREFIPHSKDNIITVSWKKHIESFEEKLIVRYCGHNLRELNIYKAGPA